MSNSLFDCAGWGENAPNTEYVIGDKKFSNIATNDILYRINCFNCIDELIVTRALHKVKGHYFISVKGRERAICLGPVNCANTLKNNDASIVYIGYSIVGTNKESIINAKRQQLENEINRIKTELKYTEDQLNNLNFLTL